jgi:hypothetical protein
MNPHPGASATGEGGAKETAMDPNVVPLYYLSSLVGLVMVVGAIWLIHREKVYIDSLRACRAAGIAQRSAADSDCRKTAALVDLRDAPSMAAVPQMRRV